jgi:aminoglycoside phosphotransferase
VSILLGLLSKDTCLKLGSEARREDSPRPTHPVSTVPREVISRLPAPDGSLTVIRPLAPEVQELLRFPDRNLRSLQAGSQQRPPLKNLLARNLLEVIERGKVIWDQGVSIVKFNARIVVKFGSGMDIDEAVTMAHIRKHAPALPIPESLGVASIDGYKYHFMTFIEGTTLDKVWPSLTPPMKQSIQLQLCEIMQRLRRIPLPPDPAIGSGDPPRCKDFRRQVRIAPAKIYTENDFNEFLLSGHHTHDRGTTPFYLRMLRSRMRTDHRMCITHGDLRPANIVVQQAANGAVHIKGLVDWGDSGVYPEYWEFVRALYLFRLGSDDDWYDYLPTQAIGSYFSEYLLDDHIHGIVGGM